MKYQTLYNKVENKPSVELLTQTASMATRLQRPNRWYTFINYDSRSLFDCFTCYICLVSKDSQATILKAQLWSAGNQKNYHKRTVLI